MVASPFPASDLIVQSLLVRNASVETLTSQDTQLNLSHIEPTTMLGSIVNLQLIKNTFGFRWLERFVERRGYVGVELVVHQANFDDMGIRVLCTFT